MHHVSNMSVTLNGAGAGGTRLTLQGANFGTSAIGWHMDGCIRYRDPEAKDVTQCLAGESIFFGAGFTNGLVAEWTSDTQITGRYMIDRVDV